MAVGAVIGASDSACNGADDVTGVGADFGGCGDCQGFGAGVDDGTGADDGEEGGARDGAIADDGADDSRNDGKNFGADDGTGDSAMDGMAKTYGDPEAAIQLSRCEPTRKAHMVAQPNL